jgi:hypothetical protein
MIVTGMNKVRGMNECGRNEWRWEECIVMGEMNGGGRKERLQQE